MGSHVLNVYVTLQYTINVALKSIRTADFNFQYKLCVLIKKRSSSTKDKDFNFLFKKKSIGICIYKYNMIM